MSTQSPPLFKLGITGTIGSGKSLVGGTLEKEGVPIIDTDKVVSWLYEHDQSLQEAMVAELGAKILDKTGHIDKTKLRPLVFHDPRIKAFVDTLVHPRVRQKMTDFMTRPDAVPTTPLSWLRVALVPLLFEAQTQQHYDEIWTVMTPTDILIPRLMKRSGISETEAKHRLSTQWPQEDKARLANVIIDNSGSPSETEQQILAELARLRVQYTQTPLPSQEAHP